MLYKLRRYIATHIRPPYKVLLRENNSPELIKKIKIEYARSALIGGDIRASWFLDVLGIEDYSLLDYDKRGYLVAIEYYWGKKQYILLLSPKEHTILVPRKGHCLSLSTRNMITDLTTSSHYSPSLFISDMTL